MILGECRALWGEHERFGNVLTDYAMYELYHHLLSLTPYPSEALLGSEFTEAQSRATSCISFSPHTELGLSLAQLFILPCTITLALNSGVSPFFSAIYITIVSGPWVSTIDQDNYLYGLACVVKA